MERIFYLGNVSSPTQTIRVDSQPDATRLAPMSKETEALLAVAKAGGDLKTLQKVADALGIPGWPATLDAHTAQGRTAWLEAYWETKRQAETEILAGRFLDALTNQFGTVGLTLAEVGQFIYPTLDLYRAQEAFKRVLDTKREASHD